MSTHALIELWRVEIDTTTTVDFVGRFTPGAALQQNLGDGDYEVWTEDGFLLDCFRVVGGKLCLREPESLIERRIELLTT